MVQIAKTLLPGKLKFHIALRRIFGIGPTTAVECAEAVGISKDMKVRDVKESYIRQCAQYVQNKYVVGDERKRQIRDDILRLIQINSYRGTRHELGLPLHGQNTHSNANTAAKFRRHILYDVK